MKSSSEFEAAALAYCKMGWRVFPLRPRNKLPHIKEWQIKATTSPDEIKRWWRKWQDANVAVATGRESGIWALDVDPKNGGDESLETLINKHGKLPDTVEALTGGGGRHFLFTMPDGITINNTAGHLGPGLDTRGAGGYIAVAPSIHPSGRAYDWEASSEPGDVPVAAAPDWLIELLKTAKPTNGANGETSFSKGGRNNALASLAGSMRRKGLSVDAITQALLVTNEQQCQPPLRDNEVRAIAESVGRYEPEDAVTDEQAKPDTRLRVYSVAELVALDTPPRETLLDPWLPLRGLTLIYSWRGIGKTWFMLECCRAIASGGAFLCWEAARPAGVLYLDGELPGPLLKQMVEDVLGRSSTPLVAPFDVVPFDFQEFGMPDLATPEGQAAISQIIRPEHQLIVADNISTLCRTGEENSAEGWRPVQEWGLRIRQTGRSVAFIHHEGKGGDQRGTSKREDVMETVVNLRAPKKPTAGAKAQFDVSFEKHRGFYGTDAEPLHVWLPADGKTWEYSTIEATAYTRFVKLNQEHPEWLTKDFADALDVSNGRISQFRKRLQQDGQ